MHFTREPLVETIIIPKEGFKLLIRSSKSGPIEEFYVDSVQVVLMGGHCFYRSIERPKPFLLPTSDYEVIEVKEARLQLKIPGKEMAQIKIAGGRETTLKVAKEPPVFEGEGERLIEEPLQADEGALQTSSTAPSGKHRDKKRRRFRKGRKDDSFSESSEKGIEEKPPSLIPPPATLISETISRYKEVPDFAGAFYEKEEKSEEEEIIEPAPSAKEDGEEVPRALREENEDSDFLIP